jgi:hypothetical protein
LICEVAASQRKEVPTKKLQLYVEHGFYKEYLVSITKRNRRIGRNKSNDD